MTASLLPRSTGIWTVLKVRLHTTRVNVHQSGIRSQLHTTDITSVHSTIIQHTIYTLLRNYETSMRYDTIYEFNVDSKVECGQLNLAHVARN